MKQSRRDFFKSTLMGLLALPLLKSTEVLAKACAPATTDNVKKKLLAPDSKTAKRLEFTLDAGSDAATKHKKFTAGANCGNCSFYKADKAEPTYGKCSMAGNKYVPECGWCKSYKVNKKAKKA